jgi:hypothetical protein
MNGKLFGGLFSVYVKMLSRRLSDVEMQARDKARVFIGKDGCNPFFPGKKRGYKTRFFLGERTRNFERK